MLVRRHWILVASLAALALVLLVMPSAWTTELEGHTRGGQSFRYSLAERGLIMSGCGLALYVAAGIGAVRHWAMRPPTEGEVTVARWLMRGAGLVILWLSIYATIP